MNDIEKYIFLLFKLYEEECHKYKYEYSFDKWYKLYYTSLAHNYQDLDDPDEKTKAYFTKTFKLLDEVGDYLNIDWGIGLG